MGEERVHITDQKVVCKGWEVRGGGFSVKQALVTNPGCDLTAYVGSGQQRGRDGGVTADTSSALHLRVTRTIGIPGGQRQVEAAEGPGERWWEVVPSQEETLASDPRR